MSNVTHNSFLCVYLHLLTLYMFQAHRAHHQERQIVSIQPLLAVTLCRWPCRVQVWRPAHDTVTDTEWQLAEVVLTQFVSPDDEHDVLETCRELKNINKHIEKNCASRWSFTTNHYMMHGQQNIKFYIFISRAYLYVSHINRIVFTCCACYHFNGPHLLLKSTIINNETVLVIYIDLLYYTI
jgi:hypothetical protein